MSSADSFDPESIREILHIFKQSAKGLSNYPLIEDAYMSSFLRHEKVSFNTLSNWLRTFRRWRHMWTDLRGKADVPDRDQAWSHYVSKYGDHHPDGRTRELFEIIYEFAPFIANYRTVAHGHMQVIRELEDPAYLVRFFNDLMDAQMSINELLDPWVVE